MSHVTGCWTAWHSVGHITLHEGLWSVSVFITSQIDSGSVFDNGIASVIKMEHGPLEATGPLAMVGAGGTPRCGGGLSGLTLSCMNTAHPGPGERGAARSPQGTHLSHPPSVWVVSPVLTECERLQRWKEVKWKGFMSDNITSLADFVQI